MLSKAAKTGAGVVMAPRYIVQNALDSGELKKLFSVNDTENLALYAVYPHRTLVSIKVRAFVDHLSEVFAQQSL